jgi:hypothetical protein
VLKGHSRTLAQTTCLYAPIVTTDLAALERAVLAQAPPSAVVVGASVSPDGKYGAALTPLPTASDYLMDDVLVRSRDGWESYTGGSGGGISWTTLHETDDVGVLRCGGEAPPGATVAWIRYEDAEHRVPVRHGHVLRCLEHGRPRGSAAPSLRLGQCAPRLTFPNTAPAEGSWSCIESEDDLVRFLVAPVSESAPLAHDTKAALRQHANRRSIVARSAGVQRTGCLQLQELL